MVFFDHERGTLLSERDVFVLAFTLLRLKVRNMYARFELTSVNTKYIITYFKFR